MRGIPGVVSHERRSGRRKGAPPETSDAVRLDALSEDGGAPGSLSLERGFEGVDGRQDHAECCGTERGKNILDGDGEMLEEGVGLEEGVDAGVGGGVAEAGCWSWICGLCVSIGDGSGHWEWKNSPWKRAAPIPS